MVRAAASLWQFATPQILATHSPLDRSRAQGDSRPAPPPPLGPHRSAVSRERDLHRGGHQLDLSRPEQDARRVAGLRHFGHRHRGLCRLRGNIPETVRASVPIYAGGVRPAPGDRGRPPHQRHLVPVRRPLHPRHRHRVAARTGERRAGHRGARDRVLFHRRRPDPALAAERPRRLAAARRDRAGDARHPLSERAAPRER